MSFSPTEMAGDFINTMGSAMDADVKYRAQKRQEEMLSKKVNISAHPAFMKLSQPAQEAAMQYFKEFGAVDETGTGTVGAIQQAMEVGMMGQDEKGANAFQQVFQLQEQDVRGRLMSMIQKRNEMFESGTAPEKLKAMDANIAEAQKQLFFMSQEYTKVIAEWEKQRNKADLDRETAALEIGLQGEKEMTVALFKDQLDKNKAKELTPQQVEENYRFWFNAVKSLETGGMDNPTMQMLAASNPAFASLIQKGDTEGLKRKARKELDYFNGLRQGGGPSKGKDPLNLRDKLEQLKKNAAPRGDAGGKLPGDLVE